MFAHFVAKSARDLVASKMPTAPPAVGGGSEAKDTRHLEAAAAWLVRSIEACGGRGSSKAYRFLKGWMPPYPETSGYIIPTMFLMDRELGGSDFRLRAEAIGDWLISIQRSDGGFCGRELGVLDTPVVFDTGMILLGFNALICETGENRFREAGQRAAEFLVSCQDDTGCFVRNLSNGVLHAYNVRTAWGLAAFGKLIDESRFVEAGLANARWTVAQQQPNGFYRNNTFTPGGNANTHSVAYVMQGLLQIHELTAAPKALDSVTRAADAVQARYNKYGWIASELGHDWEYLSRHVCLTGYAQLAIVLFRLSQLTGDSTYFDTARRLLDRVALSQDLRFPPAPHTGAIAGSFPIYGRYAPLQYPNWATKFFIDALIAKRHAERGERDLARLQLYAG